MQKLKRAEETRLASECRAAKTTFIKDKVEEVVARGVDPDVAQRMAEGWADRVLTADVVLQFDELAEVRVADILADPRKFEGEALADPIEGPEYGHATAKVLVRKDGTPFVNFSRMAALVMS